MEKRAFVSLLVMAMIFFMAGFIQAEEINLDSYKEKDPNKLVSYGVSGTTKSDLIIQAVGPDDIGYSPSLKTPKYAPYHMSNDKFLKFGDICRITRGAIIKTYHQDGGIVLCEYTGRDGPSDTGFNDLADKDGWCPRRVLFFLTTKKFFYNLEKSSQTKIINLYKKRLVKKLLGLSE